MESNKSKGKFRASFTVDSVGESNRTRRVWSKSEERALLDLLKELGQDPRFKQDNQFRGGYLAELQARMYVKFPGTDLKAVPHITSKMDTWKRYYNCVQTLVNNAGFGWNDTLKIVECDSEEVWMEFEKKDEYVRHVRDKSMPYYDDWLEIWGKDRATGEYAQTPDDILRENEQQQLDEQDIGNKGGQGVEPEISEINSSSTTRHKRKKSGTSQNDMSTVSSSIFELSQAIDKRLGAIGVQLGKRSLQREELSKFLDAISFDNIFDRFKVAAEIGKKPELLDQFCVLAPVERIDMVKYVLSYLN